jgi:hypothetical protein
VQTLLEATDTDADMVLLRLSALCHVSGCSEQCFDLLRRIRSAVHQTNNAPLSESQSELQIERSEFANTRQWFIALFGAHYRRLVAAECLAQRSAKAANQLRFAIELLLFMDFAIPPKVDAPIELGSLARRDAEKMLQVFNQCTGLGLRFPDGFTSSFSRDNKTLHMLEYHAHARMFRLNTELFTAEELAAVPQHVRQFVFRAMLALGNLFGMPGTSIFMHSTIPVYRMHENWLVAMCMCHSDDAMARKTEIAVCDSSGE